MTLLHAELRRQVVARAGGCCEYCRLSQDDSTFTFQVDHVIAEKHEGETILDNLALSCPACNCFKGSDIGSMDRETGQLVALYNPRTQPWNAHFRLDGPQIVPLTPEGRVTARLLRLNHPDPLEERRGLIALGRYPCQPPE